MTYVEPPIEVRLREHADEFDNSGVCDNPLAYPDLYREAADEIERLKRSLEERYSYMEIEGACGGETAREVERLLLERRARIDREHATRNT